MHCTIRPPPGKTQAQSERTSAAQAALTACESAGSGWAPLGCAASNAKSGTAEAKSGFSFIEILIARWPSPCADPTRPPWRGTPPAAIDAGAVAVGIERAIGATSSPWSPMPAQTASAADLGEIL